MTEGLLHVGISEGIEDSEIKNILFSLCLCVSVAIPEQLPFDIRYSLFDIRYFKKQKIRWAENCRNLMVSNLAICYTLVCPWAVQFGYARAYAVPTVFCPRNWNLF